ncbi:MAG: hypothetical protein GY808_07670, partial [Gammaproteobacteria bacterium]|nr:hypothetical protein [Gammaproteobacteria bacterium]
MKNKISHVLPTMLLWPFIYILAFSSILNAQDCVYKITPPSTSDHTAIVFEIISPGDGELINNIVISGKISPPPPRQGSGDESLYALRLNGDVWYLIAGRSTSQFEDFGGTTYEISLNEIYETSPPEYSFDITIIQGVAASFPQNWELHIDKLKPTEQYTIQADFTSNATIAGDFFNVIRCPQPDISITDVYNTSIGPLNFPETTVGELRDSIIRLHNGTGPNVADLVISSYSISPSDNFSTSISGSVVPGGAVDFTVSFIPDEGLPPGNVATEVLTIDLYGIPAIPAEILDLNGVAVKHDFMICLDISGSMDLDAAGNWEVP